MLIKINTTFPCEQLNIFDFEGNRYSYFFFGSCYLENEKEIIKAAIKEDSKYLSKLIGDFTLVLYDYQKQELKLLSDRPGKQNVFYCLKGKECIISDDFWEIKQALSFGIEQIDIDALKQQIMFFTCLGNKTILKNVKLVPAASIVKMDLQNNREFISRYWFFSYEENSLSHDDKLDLIDNAFDNSLKTIKSLNPDEHSFAIGVSGGLDSRLIPYYAQKNGLNIEGFTVGLEKPNKLFLANDFNSANKIAKHFDIDRKTINYNSMSFKQQIELESILAPETGSQLFKVVDESQIKSNVLITGASGFIVGASPMYSSIHDHDLLEHTLLYQSLLTNKPPRAKYKKALNYFTGANLKFKPEVAYGGLGDFFTQSDTDKAINSINGFYNEFKGLSNSEKLMNYAIFGLGRNNAKGAFESFLGQMKAYSIYTPFFLDVVSKFSESELLNRRLFQEFFVERLPQLSMIQGQEYRPMLSSKKNALMNFSRKVTAMGNFVIRGNGVMNYENWVNSSEFIQLKKEMDDKSKDITNQLGLSLGLGDKNVHPALKQNILKMQSVLLKL